MKKISEKEIKSYINKDNGFTAVFWYSNDCPVCKQFLEEVLPEVEKTASNWSFFKINFEDHVKENGCYFEPPRMPMGYFFKGKNRLFVGDGFAPSHEVIDLLFQLESPNFKTDKQKEDEQLALL